MKLWTPHRAARVTFGHLTVLMALLLAGPAAAQAQAPPGASPSLSAALPTQVFAPPADLDLLLSREPWQEPMHGLSLRPPLGSQLQRQSVDDALVRIAGSEGYVISVYMRRSQQPMELPRLVELAMTQLAGLEPSARVADHGQATIDGRAARVIYFFIPERQREPWLLGQAFVALDPIHFVHLRLEVAQKSYLAVRPVFESVLHSLRIEDPARLEARRRDLIDRGKQVQQAIGLDELKRRLVAEQWYRIVQGRRDVGYMRMTQGTGTEMGVGGLGLQVKARLDLGPQVIESDSSFFLADDRSQELWSIRTTTRLVQNPPPPPGRGPPQVMTFLETGVRSGRQITVRRDGAEGLKEHQWEQPAEAYLSQVELHLLSLVLPRTASAEYGFYTYYPNTGKLSLRTERVEPAADGTFRVHSRPSPEQPEQVSMYDAAGRLLEREIGEGRRIVPATKSELAAIWNLR